MEKMMYEMNFERAESRNPGTHSEFQAENIGTHISI